MKKLFQKEDGLTLVEILAAITILGIIFIGFLSIFPRMTEINSQTEVKLETMNLARVELHEIKSDDGTYLLSYDREAPLDPEEDSIIFTKSVDNLNYKVTYYTKNTIEMEPDVNPNPSFIELYQIHLEIKNEDQVISETFGYVPFKIN